MFAEQVLFAARRFWVYNSGMNNLFIEGPIQTGKSTTIRNVLKDAFGPELSGVRGFTSQRITDPAGKLLAFRLAPADAEISIVADPSRLDNIFKSFTPDGTRVDMTVFETAGIDYMKKALADARAGRAHTILLDEIGGHELASEKFRRQLYELLDSEIPCIGVIKSSENTRHMDADLLQLNQELHDRITGFSCHLRRIASTTI